MLGGYLPVNLDPKFAVDRSNSLTIPTKDIEHVVGIRLTLSQVAKESVHGAMPRPIVDSEDQRRAHNSRSTPDSKAIDRRRLPTANTRVPTELSVQSA